jgi:hypothetical protein
VDSEKIRNLKTIRRIIGRNKKIRNLKTIQRIIERNSDHGGSRSRKFRKKREGSETPKKLKYKNTAVYR